MLKPFSIACLAGTGLLMIGAFLWAGAGVASSTRRPDSSLIDASASPDRVSAKVIDGRRRLGLPGPISVAMQETATTAKQSTRTESASDHGWIGVMFEESAGQGIRVAKLFPGGPAAFAGLRVGDVLVRVGEAAPESVSAATAAIERLVPGQQTSFTVRRRGKPLELKVDTESLAEFQAHYVREMLRRDPRDPKYAQHHGVSEADMSVELVRRLFEQHERLERKMEQVLDEVHALRKQVDRLQK